MSSPSSNLWQNFYSWMWNLIHIQRKRGCCERLRAGWFFFLIILNLKCQRKVKKNVIYICTVKKRNWQKQLCKTSQNKNISYSVLKVPSPESTFCDLVATVMLSLVLILLLNWDFVFHFPPGYLRSESSLGDGTSMYEIQTVESWGIFKAEEIRRCPRMCQVSGNHG